MSIVSKTYNLIFLPAAGIFITLVKPFNKKLREREGLWEDILQEFLDNSHTSSTDTKRVWFHAASMGEFEQAKPVIEELKTRLPEIKIICSFYSPSGFNNQKNYRFSDGNLYMPLDKPSNARYFINSINPSVAVFVRYEFWLNHLKELKKRKVPSILICATEPNNKILKKCNFLKSFMKETAGYFNEIYTVGKIHTDYFKSLLPNGAIHTSKDTRFDRIAKKVEGAKIAPILPRELFNDDELVLVAGSSWQPDEEMIIKAANRISEEGIGKVRLVFVPHEPTKSHIAFLKGLIPEIALLSEVEHKFDSGYSLNSLKKWFAGRHIAVDSIGKLLSLYSCADAAHIGGGFGVGVHSVTEPAGYGIPLSTGIKFVNSPDAVILKELGALTINKNDDDFYTWLKMLILDRNERDRIGSISSDYLHSDLGASSMIAEKIIELLMK